MAWAQHKGIQRRRGPRRARPVASGHPRGDPRHRYLAPMGLALGRHAGHSHHRGPRYRRHRLHPDRRPGAHRAQRRHRLPLQHHHRPRLTFSAARLRAEPPHLRGPDPAVSHPPGLDIFSRDEAGRTIRPVNVQQRSSGGSCGLSKDFAEFRARRVLSVHRREMGHQRTGRPPRPLRWPCLAPAQPRTHRVRYQHPDRQITPLTLVNSYSAVAGP